MFGPAKLLYDTVKKCEQTDIPTNATEGRLAARPRHSSRSMTFLIRAGTMPPRLIYDLALNQPELDGNHQQSSCSEFCWTFTHLTLSLQLPVTDVQSNKQVQNEDEDECADNSMDHC